MKKYLLVFVVGFVIGFLLGWLFMNRPTPVKASTSHREWSDWSHYGAWGNCQVKTELTCGATVEGFKERTKTRTCQNHNGNGQNECSFVGQIDTHTDRDKCEVKLPECKPNYPAEGQCTTQCGLSGGIVPDGNGGTKQCPTNPPCGGSTPFIEPSCKDLGAWAPTITKVGRVDKDTVMACWTKPSDNADSYEIWYGLSKDKLVWNTESNSLCVEISGKELVGHVWVKVAAKSEGCVGNFSIVTDP